MRLLLAALLLFTAAPAFAQDAEKAPVNWVEVESTGTLKNAKEGALEKTLWKGQKRSDIEAMIAKLPDTQRLRSALSLQRRLLMSHTDTALMVDDDGPMRGNDLLIQRIKKLMDMGLYDDAWTLYTQKAEDPYDVSIAQMGMLLLVMKNDLATACLEEKVFSAQYPEDKFFDTLDAACAETMGMTKTPDFPNSKVLQAVYHDATYGVSASVPGILGGMSDMERALVLANGKIRYDGLTPAILSTTPSKLVSLYLMDKKLPESAKAMIKAETDKRGLTWYIASVARDPVWKKAKDMGKDKDSQWPVLESALKENRNPADMKAYAAMLSDSAPAQLSTDVLIKGLGVLLAANQPLPDFWLKKAQDVAPQKPLIYIYLQLFESLTPTPGAAVTPENLKKGFEAVKPEHAGQILAIIQTLDKDSGISDSLLSIYEKHSLLTSEGNYVMPSLGTNEPLDEALDKKHLGITVLAILNSLAAKPDLMYSGTVRFALNSMLNVGLIEDAKLIGSETVAGVLSNY